MRRTIPAILFVLAFCVPVLAQPAPFVAQEPETIHSDADLDRKIPGETVQAVLDPVYGVDGQYARWKKPLCFNVYGLKPAAKYFVERRMREIARQVGAPVDRHDPCAPNATIIFTTSTKATLDSIEKALPRMLLVDYGFIRNRLKESQPIQAWYGVSTRGAEGRDTLQLGDGDIADTGTPRVMRVPDMSRLNTGISTALQTVVIVADTNAVMGKSLDTLAGHFALLALAQARDTRHCKAVPTIANLMIGDCEAALRPDAITGNDLAMLTALYQTQDESLQVLQQQRIIGAMARTLGQRPR